MEILYYLLIFLASSIGTLGLFHILKKYENKRELIIKIVALSLSFVMFIRYMLGESVISHVRGLNMYSPFGDNVFITALTLIIGWFSYVGMLMLALYPFFKVNNIKNVIKFLALPTFILDFIFFKQYAISISGINAFNGFDLRVFLLSLEVVISLSLTISVFVRKDYFKVEKNELKTLMITILPILLAVIPAHMIQSLFGFAKSDILILEDLTFEHRIMLYGSIAVPIILYFIFKNKSYEIRRFSMVYLSVATLWTFMYRFNFIELMNPLDWPLHLCNTAMYIIPICLIFKLDKVFYFTLFINVMGAFIAMAMPNTDAINILQTSSIMYWINHYCAFFMPVLLIALRLFERPKLKQWIYSMVAFTIYFIFILIINAWFSNYGSVDYFFVNSDFITDKLGDWAAKTRDILWVIKINDLTLVFYPVYQLLFYLVYSVISLAIWFLYEQLFQMWDLGDDMRLKEQEYKKMKRDLAILLEGRSEDEPMSGNGEPCLELKSFSKKYGVNKHYSVKDASFKVNGGEIFGFLGPNGAGKSTIIKSIVGIQTITSGNIEICGYDVEKQSVQAKKQIGFVPDHYALYENLTGREYINYIADLYEVKQEDRDARIGKYVTNFNLEGAFDNQMKTYSHGMKQKITIMAALVHNPKVWILDEPLTGLDPTSIYQVKEAMKDHAKAGNIVFFSSHIIDVVERICDRIAIIKKGNILVDVKVKDLEKQNINLEEFYLETINAELIAEYSKYEPASVTNVDVKSVSTKKNMKKKKVDGDNNE